MFVTSHGPAGPGRAGNCAGSDGVARAVAATVSDCDRPRLSFQWAKIRVSVSDSAPPPPSRRPPPDSVVTRTPGTPPGPG